MKKQIKSVLLAMILISLLPTMVYGFGGLRGILGVDTDSWDSDSHSVVLTIKPDGAWGITRRYYGVSGTQYTHLKSLKGKEVLLRYHQDETFRFIYDSCTLYDGGTDSLTLQPRSVMP